MSNAGKATDQYLRCIDPLVGGWRAAPQILSNTIVCYSFTVVHLQPGQENTATQEAFIEGGEQPWCAPRL